MDIGDELIGKSVVIEWRNEECDWENYCVEGIDTDVEWIKLSGERADDGTTYTGGTTFVPLLEIATIMLRAPTGDNGARYYG